MTPYTPNIRHSVMPAPAGSIVSADEWESNPVSGIAALVAAWQREQYQMQPFEPIRPARKKAPRKEKPAAVAAKVHPSPPIPEKKEKESPADANKKADPAPASKNGEKGPRPKSARGWRARYTRPGFKTCAHCERELPYEDFSERADTGGLKSWCRVCSAEGNRRRRDSAKRTTALTEQINKNL